VQRFARRHRAAVLAVNVVVLVPDVAAGAGGAAVVSGCATAPTADFGSKVPAHRAGLNVVLPRCRAGRQRGAARLWPAAPIPEVRRQSRHLSALRRPRTFAPACCRS